MSETSEHRAHRTQFKVRVRHHGSSAPLRTFGPYETKAKALDAIDQKRDEALRMGWNLVFELVNPREENSANNRVASSARHDRGYDRLTIMTAMARALFVDTWATYEEERGRGRSFSGQDLMDVAPATPPPARAAAKVLAKKIELTNGASLTDLYDRAVTVGGKEDPDAFGHYLAMQALGHGVSWFDRNPEFPLVVPSFEFAKTSARHYYFPRS